jgi:hypothetical protein
MVVDAHDGREHEHPDERSPPSRHLPRGIQEAVPRRTWVAMVAAFAALSSCSPRRRMPAG